MIATKPIAKLAPPASTTSPWSATIAVALMSFAALLLELGLTRLFSVVLFYHFAFLAISIALLGLGAGAVFAYLRRQWLSQWSIDRLGATLCAANAVVILLVLEIVVHTAVSLHLDWQNLWRLTVLYLASAVPFFITGLLFSIVFARHTARITQLYGADLLGGSLACLALVPLLNFVGGPNTILFAAVAVALAAVAWATPAKRPLPACIAIAFLLLIAINFRGRLIDIVYAKGMKREAPLFARWNAISRVEVDNQGPGKAIVIDADAQTSLMNTEPHNWSEDYRRHTAISPLSGPAEAWTCCARSLMAAPMSQASRSIPSSPTTSCATTSPTTPITSTRFPRCTSMSAMDGRSCVTAATATTRCR
jgi:hypothetical protein